MSGGTGRVGLTIVGQVVGSYFGPIGAAIGGAIGSYIGGQIWPEQFEGPKLEGLQVTSSAYGGPIGKVYGAYRVGGNIIWASEIREVASTEGQGKDAELTTYSYYVDLAIGVCEGPIAGLRRIYADQKLIYDNSSDDPNSIYASYARGGDGMTFYSGTEDQLPDPTIEAALGVGDTPAFRGLTYVVFENFDLSTYGNRTPNFNFEVVSTGEDIGPRQILGMDWPIAAYGDVRIAQVGGEMICRYEGDWDILVLPAAPHHGEQRYESVGPIGAIITDLDGTNIRYGAPDLFSWPLNRTTDSGGSLLIWPDPQYEDPAVADFGIYVDYMTGTNDASSRALNLIARATTDEDGRTIIGEENYTAQLDDGGNFLYSIVPCVDRQHVLCLLDTADTTPEDCTYWVLYRYVDGAFTEVRRGTIDQSSGYTPYPNVGSMTSYDGAGEPYSAAMLEGDLRHVWMMFTGGAHEMHLWHLDNDGTMSFVSALQPSTPSIDTNARACVYADNAVCWLVTSGYKLHAFTRSPQLGEDVPLSDVVSSICEDAGLDPATDINVEDLEDTTVRGYFRTPRMSARAAIEPLMTGYAFDAVESDLKIKFVLRNAESVATFDADDIGAGNGGPAECLVESERAQESELPLSIDVTYAAASAGYQLGTQSFKRQATTSVDSQSMRLPLALSDQEAAEIASRLVYELWIARTTRRWASSVKYTQREPTDVVTLETEDASYVVRITNKQENGNLIAWEGIDVDAAAFNPTNTATTIPGDQTMGALPGLTHAIAADLPPLVEAHFGNTGYYAAAAGFSVSWPGATLYRKPEASSQWTAELTFSTAATIGGTSDALWSHGYTGEDGTRVYAGYYPDHCNTVTVTLTSGSLSSCTDEEFLNLQNVALVGREIIAFRDVDDLGDGTYTLSCLLRGLYGTEWFAAQETESEQGHTSGDDFLLIDTALVQHFDTQSLTSRVQGYVRTVTAGGSLSATGQVLLEQTYSSIVQPHPTHIEAALNDDGDIVLNFAPRTFVDPGWNDGRDAWLDPTHQEYIVEVVNTADELYSARFVVNGPPPHTLYAAQWAGAVSLTGEVTVRVGATPRQMPGANSEAFVSDPDIANRHWSRRVLVDI